MNHYSIVWAIVAASAITAIIRAGPIVFFAHRVFPVIIRNWLVFVPTAILSAIIASEVIQRDQLTSFGAPVGLLATIVCFIVAGLTRSLFGAVIVSIIAYLVIQYL